MKYAFLFLLAVTCVAQVAIADIAFQLTPASSQIVQGSTGVFGLRVISTVPAGQQVDSIDFNAIAGAGNGTDGTFVSPTATTGLLGAIPVDFTSTPGQAFGSNAQVGGFLVPSGLGTLYANLYLDTTGVAPGIYSMTLSDLAANSLTLAGLPVSGNSISYEILSAVPEPTSLMTGFALASGAMFYRRRRQVG